MDFHFIAFNLGNKRLVTIMAPASGKRLLRHSINIKGKPMSKYSTLKRAMASFVSAGGNLCLFAHYDSLSILRLRPLALSNFVLPLSTYRILKKRSPDKNRLLVIPHSFKIRNSCFDRNLK